MKRALIVSLFTISIIYGCTKEEILTRPILSTNPLDYIAVTTAISGGQIISDGGAAVTTRGVFWSTNANPTISDSKTIDGDGTTPFESNLSGLTSNTIYYIRAYATNSEGTSYGDERTFTTYKSNAISDYDGNLYNIVTIGTQIWTVENLKTTRLNDGNEIPFITNISALPVLTGPVYCWYNNDAAANKSAYGALYNWYTVNSGKICPAGWHVPSRYEWETLLSNAGDGGKLKATGTAQWNDPNQGANDNSGFNALPGGICNDNFYNINNDGQWWSTTEYSDQGFNDGWSFLLFYNSDQHAFNHDYKTWCKSIRCIKD